MGKTAEDTRNYVLRSGALSSAVPLHKNAMRSGVFRKEVFLRNVLRNGEQSTRTVLPARSGGTRGIRATHQHAAAAPARPPEQRPTAWNSCTKVYDMFAEAVTRPFAEDAVRLVHMQHGSRVLDVAAGTGAFALAAARRGAEVLATDFSSGMLRELEHKCSREGVTTVHTAVMDGQALTLESASFDVAASLFGLMFFADHDRGLCELLRVLKPGGQAVVATWAPPARVEMMRLLGDAVITAMLNLPSTGEPPYWTALSDARCLQTRLLALGFARVHVVSVTHVWTFEKAEVVAKLLPLVTPSWAVVFNMLPSAQKEQFVKALIESFHDRQGDGPFAVTSTGLIAVGTKAAG
jgi:ubiquinone/menaquinone biosynthesis C-methylase UbiE